ncbi:unnamed protein product [Peronospora belbahrii]|uniref:Uncharacterized protein n=1 Tax=Peronospora belbahrii TaxID=622444 RepID=A0ABN8CY22_9STRA|nr:unnamed protein product [Peronospora belbahrii]
MSTFARAPYDLHAAYVENSVGEMPTTFKSAIKFSKRISGRMRATPENGISPKEKDVVVCTIAKGSKSDRLPMGISGQGEPGW